LQTYYDKMENCSQRARLRMLSKKEGFFPNFFLRLKIFCNAGLWKHGCYVCYNFGNGALGCWQNCEKLSFSLEGGAWRWDINDDWHNDGKVGHYSYWVIYKKIQAKNFRKSLQDSLKWFKWTWLLFFKILVF